jgi:hypothetical protein
MCGSLLFFSLRAGQLATEPLHGRLLPAARFRRAVSCPPLHSDDPAAPAQFALNSDEDGPPRAELPSEQISARVPRRSCMPRPGRFEPAGSVTWPLKPSAGVSCPSLASDGPEPCPPRRLSRRAPSRTPSQCPRPRAPHAPNRGAHSGGTETHAAARAEATRRCSRQRAGGTTISRAPALQSDAGPNASFAQRPKKNV